MTGCSGASLTPFGEPRDTKFRRLAPAEFFYFLGLAGASPMPVSALINTVQRIKPNPLRALHQGFGSHHRKARTVETSLANTLLWQ